MAKSQVLKEKVKTKKTNHDPKMLKIQKPKYQIYNEPEVLQTLCGLKSNI